MLQPGDRVVYLPAMLEGMPNAHIGTVGTVRGEDVSRSPTCVVHWDAYTKVGKSVLTFQLAVIRLDREHEAEQYRMEGA